MKVLSFIRKMVGASAGADGRSGYVPKPLAGQHGYALFGDGTYKALPGGGDMLAANDLAEINTPAKRATARTNLDTLSQSEDMARVWGMAGHVKFDGVVTGQRATAFVPGLNIGREDFSCSVVLRVPSANPNQIRQFITISSGSTGQAAYGFRAYLGTNGSLNLMLYGAVADSDIRTATVASFVSTYAGQVIRLSITRTAGTLALFVNKNAVAHSETFSGSNPPASYAESIIGQYLHIGGGSSANTYSEEIYAVDLFNYGLTQAQINELLDVGLTAGNRWAGPFGLNAILNQERNSLFTAATNTDWAVNGGGTVTVDGANDELDFSAGDEGNIAFLASSQLAQLASGRRYRLLFTIRNASSLTLAAKLYDGAGEAPGTAIQTIVSGVTADGDYNVEFTPVAGVAALGFEIGANDSCSLTNLRLEPVLALNGNFDTDGDGGFADWTESASGSSSVNRDTSVVKQGSAALRLDIDASGNFCKAAQNILTPGTKYRIRGWVRQNSGSTLTNLQFTAGINSVSVSGLSIPDSTWTEFDVVIQANGTQFGLDRPFGIPQMYEKSLWFDSISVVPAGSCASFATWGLDKETALWRNQALSGDATLVNGPAVVTGQGRIWSDENMLTQISREHRALAGGGIYFDGNPSQRVSVGLTTAQDIDVAAFWNRIRFTVPTSNPSSSRFLTAITSSPSGATAGSGVFAYISSAGDLYVAFIGATASDQRFARMDGFVSRYGGKVVNIVWCRTGTGGIAVWVNGHPQAFAEGTTGIPPAWSLDVISTYVFAPGTHIGEVFTWQLGRGTLTDALVAELTSTGIRSSSTENPIAKNGSFSAGRDGVVVDLDFSVGAGYQFPDRSGNGFHGNSNHQSHAHLVPRRQIQVRGRVATNVSTQLNGAKCIPANARISSIVINCASGTPTVDIGNAVSGEQIVKDWVLASGRNEASADGASGRALFSRFSSTENLYVTSSSSDPLDITINAELAD